jgi:hypothetical protein
VAKQPATKGGTSRIRFIMLDAEIPEGDLSQITSAIQNALKPTTTIIQQRLPSNGAQPAIGGNGVEAEPIEEEALEVGTDEQVSTPKPAKPARVRKPTTPEVIEADFNSDVSLKSFTDQHPAESEPERYLVIAAWFKEHRATPSVTTAHIYTGYRVVGWSVGLEDFGWPLRYLKKEKLMSSSARGSFDINHLGLDKVKKLRAGE